MNKVNNYRNLAKLAIVLLLFYCSSLFCLIPILLFNININNCSDLVYSLVNFFPYICLTIIFVLMYKKDLTKDFKNFIKNFGKYSDTAFKYWSIGFIMMVLTNIIIGAFSPISIPDNEESVRSLLYDSPVIAIFFSCIFGPFVEEIIFRKSFKDVFKSKWSFILISGVVFGLLHVIGSISNLYGLLYFIPYSCLGIAFAITYYDTKNIFASIFAHVMHNSLTVLLILLSQGGLM